MVGTVLAHLHANRPGTSWAMPGVSGAFLVAVDARIYVATIELDTKPRARHGIARTSLGVEAFHVETVCGTLLSHDIGIGDVPVRSPQTAQALRRGYRAAEETRAAGARPVGVMNLQAKDCGEMFKMHWNNSLELRSEWSGNETMFHAYFKSESQRLVASSRERKGFAGR